VLVHGWFEPNLNTTSPGLTVVADSWCRGIAGSLQAASPGAARHHQDLSLLWGQHLDSPLQGRREDIY